MLTETEKMSKQRKLCKHFHMYLGFILMIRRMEKEAQIIVCSRFQKYIGRYLVYSYTVPYQCSVQKLTFYNTGNYFDHDDKGFGKKTLMIIFPLL